MVKGDIKAIIVNLFSNLTAKVSSQDLELNYNTREVGGRNE